MQPTGAARTDISIVDFSVLINTALAGVTNYLGLTERGVVGKPTLIGTWPQFQQVFGGLMADSNFPFYAKRALEAGGALMVSRAAKYADPADPSTITGVVALYDATQSNVTGVGASTEMELLADADGTCSVIALVPGASNVTLADGVTIVAADSLTANVVVVKNAINAGTGSHGYTATNTGAVLTVKAPNALGAFSNGIRIQQLSSTGIVWDSFIYAMTGGADTQVNTGTLGIAALAIGAAYNGATITVTNAASNVPHFYDITVSLPGSVLTDEVYKDFPQDASTDAWTTKVTAMLAASQILGAFTANDNFTLQPIVYTLADGEDTDDLAAIDYAGDIVGATNLHSFDNDGTATKVCIPDVADPNLDLIVSAWVDQRKDLMGLLRTPIGLQPQINVDYRNGTGTYNHTPVNSWRNMMSTGGLRVLDPRTSNVVDISEVGDWAGIIASKDNAQGQWFSFAGSKRGKVFNAYGVVVNVGTPAMVAANNQYDSNGLNPVIQNAKKDILFWGNSTLWKDRTSLLCKAEVAELLVFLYRSLMELIPEETFDPNDVDTWKTIYRKVRVFMQYLQSNRAVWKWEYQGDQDIVDVSKAVVNSPDNIDAGMYKFKLFIAPKVAMKYIEVTVAVTNSGIDFSQVTGI